MAGLSTELGLEEAGSPVVVVNRQRRFFIDVPALRAFAERALLEVTTLPAAAALPQEITIVLVTDRRMRKIHLDFMGLASSTDVITFQHGDVVLSVETAQRQAKRYRSSLAWEVRLYVVHGLLHLCGYDDRTPARREEMDCLQEALLDRLLRKDGSASGKGIPGP
ncbi:MAG TPA: rRNA maturation RNase YbeY [Chthoniobacterales bacterium]